MSHFLDFGGFYNFGIGHFKFLLQLHARVYVYLDYILKYSLFACPLFSLVVHVVMNIDLNKIM